MTTFSAPGPPDVDPDRARHPDSARQGPAYADPARDRQQLPGATQRRRTARSHRDGTPRHLTLRTWTVVAAAVLATLTSAMPDAMAAYPGGNGRIAFGSNRSGSFQIYSVRPDGRGLRQLTNNSGFNACAAWSPDGRQLAFCSNQSGVFKIYVMDADGSHLRLVPTHVGSALFPRWSPSGRALLFTGATSPDAPGDVYVVNLDGSGQRNLTHDSADDAPQGASWQPGGHLIAFDRYVGGKSDLYTMRPDGTDVTRLTHTAGDNQSPDWSPDGRALTYIHGGVNSLGQLRGEVYTIDVHSGQVHQITHNTSSDDRNPAWSPKGQQIVFRRARADGTTELLRVEVTTRAVQPVITAAGSELGPSWQPDPPVTTTETAPQSPR